MPGRRWRGRRRRNVKFQRQLSVHGNLCFRIAASFLQLSAQFAIRFLQLLILNSEPLHFAVLVRFAGETERRRRYAYKKTGNKQTCGKCQEKRQDSFQHSFVQHAIHLWKTLINVYAAFSKLVSKIQPNSKFYSIPLRRHSKAFSFLAVDIFQLAQAAVQKAENRLAIH